MMLAKNGGGMVNTLFENNIKVILRETEKIASENNFTPKQEMHLRLLTEEAICMLPEIVQYGSGTFWIECFYSRFEIHIKVTPTDVEILRKNKAQKSTFQKQGILRKICAAFEDAIEESRKEKQKKKDAMTSWSLMTYIDSVKRSGKNKNLEAWDELEKSVIANLADDVTISTIDDDVEVVVVKEFSALV